MMSLALTVPLEEDRPLRTFDETLRLSFLCRWTQNGAWPRLVSQRRGRTPMEAGDD